MQKLTNYKKKNNTENWYIIDATNVRIGKLSAKVATLLMGKDKVDRVDYDTNGNKIVIINTDRVAYFPKKAITKIYYRHSGYIGGLTGINLGDQMAKDSRKVVHAAISGMLPKNKLRSKLMSNVYLYTDANHQQEAQKPQELNLLTAK